MTKRKLPSIHAAEVDRQAGRILAAFSKYLERDPRRTVVLSRPEHSHGGWLVELHDRRSARGVSLHDAGAQVATVLNIETDEVPS